MVSDSDSAGEGLKRYGFEGHDKSMGRKSGNTSESRRSKGSGLKDRTGLIGGKKLRVRV